MSDAPMNRLKLVYRDDIRVLNMPKVVADWDPETSQGEGCINKIRDLAGAFFFADGESSVEQDFDLQYVDDENDVITMNSDLELREAFRISESMGGAVLKVRVATKQAPRSRPISTPSSDLAGLSDEDNTFTMIQYSDAASTSSEERRKEEDGPQAAATSTGSVESDQACPIGDLKEPSSPSPVGNVEPHLPGLFKDNELEVAELVEELHSKDQGGWKKGTIEEPVLPAGGAEAYLCGEANGGPVTTSSPFVRAMDAVQKEEISPFARALDETQETSPLQERDSQGDSPAGNAILDIGDEWFRLFSLESSSGLSMNCLGGRGTLGEEVGLWNDRCDNSLFRVVEHDGEYVRLQPSHARDKVLSVSGVKNGSQVILWSAEERNDSSWFRVTEHKVGGIESKYAVRIESKQAVGEYLQCQDVDMASRIVLSDEYSPKSVFLLVRSQASPDFPQPCAVPASENLKEDGKGVHHTIDLSDPRASCENANVGRGFFFVEGQGGWAEYEVLVKDEVADYTFEIEMNARDPRPLRLMVNGRLVDAIFANGTTGSWWQTSMMRSFAFGPYTLGGGKTLIRMETDGYFPHVRGLRLIKESSFEINEPIEGAVVEEEKCSNEAVSRDAVHAAAKATDSSSGTESEDAVEGGTPKLVDGVAAVLGAICADLDKKMSSANYSKPSNGAASASDVATSPTTSLLDTLFGILSDEANVIALQTLTGSDEVRDFLLTVSRRQKGCTVSTAALLALPKLFAVLRALVVSAPAFLGLLAPFLEILGTEGSTCGGSSHDSTTSLGADTEDRDRPTGPEHLQVICDGCEADPKAQSRSLVNGHLSSKGYIQGVRYKSAVADDFDLCESCEPLAKWEPKSPFLKIKAPVGGCDARKPNSTVVHRYVTCDGCEHDSSSRALSTARGRVAPNGYIQGIRYKSAVADDFDLCEVCEASGRWDATHAPFLRIKHPRMAPHSIVCVLRSEPRCRPSDWRRERLRTIGRCVAKGSHEVATPTSSEKVKPLALKEQRHKAPGVPKDAHVEPVNTDMTKKVVGKPASTKVEVEVEAQPTKARVNMARFITDVTVNDGSEIIADDKVKKTWRIQNCGSFDWPIGCRLINVGGDRLSGPFKGVAVPPVAPQSTADVSVSLVAPQNAGRYVGYWRLVSPKGERFGHRVWVDITVIPRSRSEGKPSSVPSLQEQLSATARVGEEIVRDVVDTGKVVLGRTLSAITKRKEEAQAVGATEPPATNEEQTNEEQAAGAAEPPPTAAPASSKSRWEVELTQLSEMGFYDFDENRKLLASHEGNLARVINTLLSRTAS